MVSQIIYSTIGFGSGMFAISILALLYGKLELFVPFFILLCLPTELIITIKDHKLINFKKIRIFLITIIPFLFIGSLLLRQAENLIVLIILGILILTLAIYHLFLENRFKFKLKHSIWIPFFGSISGILGGLFGMAGPPLIFYFKNSKLTKRYFRVALLSIFIFMTFFRLLFYTGLNLLTKQIFMSSIIILPFSLLGLVIGYKLHTIVSEHIFKKITSIALFISGFLIILKNTIKLLN